MKKIKKQLKEGDKEYKVPEMKEAEKKIIEIKAQYEAKLQK